MKAAQVGGPGGSNNPANQQGENSNETMSPQPPDSFPSQPGDLSPPPNSQSQVRTGQISTLKNQFPPKRERE